MKSFAHFRGMSSTALLTLVSAFLIVFDNRAFFSNVTVVYPVNLENLAFLLSLVLVFGSGTFLMLALVCHRHTIKPVLITILLASSLAGFFMDSYDAIIDETMFQNVAHTDIGEAADLISVKLAMYLVLFGILPSLFVYKVRIVYAGVRSEFTSRLKAMGLALLVAVVTILVFGGTYASFFREHKPLRYYSNPSYYLYSATKYVGTHIGTHAHVFRMLGLDAKVPDYDKDRELIIFVLGETARADRFSLNGYGRDTNPLLAKEDIVNFPNFWSCGTTTAFSVPCIFSGSRQEEFNDVDASSSENLLDVLKHAGVNVLWLDNNSDSKGTATRVAYESFKTPTTNHVCDVECRDEGMLARVQEYIKAQPKGDIFIVLHQMGSHGPAYYKRYPQAFERFTPACHTNELKDCSKEEISNAYDNTIVYTDYFLSRVIDLLRGHSSKFETAMLYVSDHGESLGEHGLYLHGMPRAIAPDEQRRVPAMMWFGERFNGVSRSDLAARSTTKFSHDNVFHTILGFMEIQSSVYNKSLDIVQAGR